MHVLAEVFAPLVPVNAVLLQLVLGSLLDGLALTVTDLSGGTGSDSSTGRVVQLLRAHTVPHDH